MKVLVIKRYERDFRITFYKKLKSKLNEKKIDLELYYGEPNYVEKKSIKDYIRDEIIGRKLKNKYIKIGKLYLCYQPCYSLIKNADLVIVQQGNRELFNYLLLLRKVFFKKPKIAFWGHGKNFQGHSKSIKEKFKSWYSNKVDFWFAYNECSKKILVDRGFDINKIVSINNTIDTKSEIDYFNTISDEQKKELRNRYNIAATDPVGIFCASIYHDKQIDFLLNALDKIKARVPDFKFIIIGKGAEDYKVISYSKKNIDWLFYVGNKFHEEKILYFSIANFQLMPGAVGLNIIDSFSFLCPLITTNIGNHGPEIAYLINMDNGIMTNENIDDYANTIIKLIFEKNKHEKLIQGCDRARRIFTIESMVDNFAHGILKSLINKKE